MRQAHGLCYGRRKGWTLILRLDSSVRIGLDTKTGTLTLQDARLLCDKRMVYTAV